MDIFKLSSRDMEVTIDVIRARSVDPPENTRDVASGLLEGG